MQKPKHNNTTRPIPNIVRNPRRPPVVVNSFLENQHDFRRLKTLRGENSFSEEVKDHKGNENNIIVFSNSMANIDRNIKVELNSSIRSGRARFLNFPVATSGDLLHYMDPTLAEGNYDTAMIHLGINDIIKDDISTKVEHLVSNSEEIVIN